MGYRPLMPLNSGDALKPTLLDKKARREWYKNHPEYKIDDRKFRTEYDRKTKTFKSDDLEYAFRADKMNEYFSKFQPSAEIEKMSMVDKINFYNNNFDKDEEQIYREHANLWGANSYAYADAAHEAKQSNSDLTSTLTNEEDIKRINQSLYDNRALAETGFTLGDLSNATSSTYTEKDYTNESYSDQIAKLVKDARSLYPEFHGDDLPPIYGSTPSTGHLMRNKASEFERNEVSRKRSEYIMDNLRLPTDQNPFINLSYDNFVENFNQFSDTYNKYKGTKFLPENEIDYEDLYAEVMPYINQGKLYKAKKIIEDEVNDIVGDNQKIIDSEFDYNENGERVKLAGKLEVGTRQFAGAAVETFANDFVAIPNLLVTSTMTLFNNNTFAENQSFIPGKIHNLQKTISGEDQVYGHGLWSEVAKASYTIGAMAGNMASMTLTGGINSANKVGRVLRPIDAISNKLDVPAVPKVYQGVNIAMSEAQVDAIENYEDNIKEGERLKSDAYKNILAGLSSGAIEPVSTTPEERESALQELMSGATWDEIFNAVGQAYLQQNPEADSVPKEVYDNAYNSIINESYSRAMANKIFAAQVGELDNEIRREASRQYANNLLTQTALIYSFDAIGASSRGLVKNFQDLSVLRQIRKFVKPSEFTDKANSVTKFQQFAKGPVGKGIGKTFKSTFGELVTETGQNVNSEYSKLKFQNNIENYATSLYYGLGPEFASSLHYGLTSGWLDLGDEMLTNADLMDTWRSTALSTIFLTNVHLPGVGKSNREIELSNKTKMGKVFDYIHKFTPIQSGLGNAIAEEKTKEDKENINEASLRHFYEDPKIQELIRDQAAQIQSQYDLEMSIRDGNVSDVVRNSIAANITELILLHNAAASDYAKQVVKKHQDIVDIFENPNETSEQTKQDIINDLRNNSANNFYANLTDEEILQHQYKTSKNFLKSYEEVGAEKKKIEDSGVNNDDIRPLLFGNILNRQISKIVDEHWKQNIQSVSLEDKFDEVLKVLDYKLNRKTTDANYESGTNVLRSLFQDVVTNYIKESSANKRNEYLERNANNTTIADIINAIAAVESTNGNLDFIQTLKENSSLNKYAQSIHKELSDYYLDLRVFEGKTTKKRKEKINKLQKIAANSELRNRIIDMEQNISNGNIYPFVTTLRDILTNPKYTIEQRKEIAQQFKPESATDNKRKEDLTTAWKLLHAGTVLRKAVDVNSNIVKESRQDLVRSLLEIINQLPENSIPINLNDVLQEFDRGLNQLIEIVDDESNSIHISNVSDLLNRIINNPVLSPNSYSSDQNVAIANALSGIVFEAFDKVNNININNITNLWDLNSPILDDSEAEVVKPVLSDDEIPDDDATRVSPEDELRKQEQEILIKQHEEQVERYNKLQQQFVLLQSKIINDEFSNTIESTASIYTQVQDLEKTIEDESSNIHDQSLLAKVEDLLNKVKLIKEGVFTQKETLEAYTKLKNLTQLPDRKPIDKVPDDVNVINDLNELLNITGFTNNSIIYFKNNDKIYSGKITEVDNEGKIISLVELNEDYGTIYIIKHDKNGVTIVDESERLDQAKDNLKLIIQQNSTFTDTFEDFGNIVTILNDSKLLKNPKNKELLVRLYEKYNTDSYYLTSGQYKIYKELETWYNKYKDKTKKIVSRKTLAARDIQHKLKELSKGNVNKIVNTLWVPNYEYFDELVDIFLGDLTKNKENINIALNRFKAFSENIINHPETKIALPFNDDVVLFIAARILDVEFLPYNKWRNSNKKDEKDESLEDKANNILSNWIDKLNDPNADIPRFNISKLELKGRLGKIKKKFLTDSGNIETWQGIADSLIEHSNYSSDFKREDLYKLILDKLEAIDIEVRNGRSSIKYLKESLLSKATKNDDTKQDAYDKYKSEVFNEVLSKLDISNYAIGSDREFDDIGASLLSQYIDDYTDIPDDLFAFDDQEVYFETESLDSSKATCNIGVTNNNVVARFTTPSNETQTDNYIEIVIAKDRFVFNTNGNFTDIELSTLVSEVFKVIPNGSLITLVDNASEGTKKAFDILKQHLLQQGSEYRKVLSTDARSNELNSTKQILVVQSTAPGKNGIYIYYYNPSDPKFKSIVDFNNETYIDINTPYGNARFALLTNNWDYAHQQGWSDYYDNGGEITELTPDNCSIEVIESKPLPQKSPNEIVNNTKSSKPPTKSYSESLNKNTKINKNTVVNAIGPMMFDSEKSTDYADVRKVITDGGGFYYVNRGYLKPNDTIKFVVGWWYTKDGEPQRVIYMVKDVPSDSKPYQILDAIDTTNIAPESKLGQLITRIDNFTGNLPFGAFSDVIDPNIFGMTVKVKSVSGGKPITEASNNDGQFNHENKNLNRLLDKQDGKYGISRGDGFKEAVLVFQGKNQTIEYSISDPNLVAQYNQDLNDTPDHPRKLYDKNGLLRENQFTLFVPTNTGAYANVPVLAVSFTNDEIDGKLINVGRETGRQIVRDSLLTGKVGNIFKNVLFDFIKNLHNQFIQENKSIKTDTKNIHQIFTSFLRLKFNTSVHISLIDRGIWTMNENNEIVPLKTIDLNTGVYNNTDKKIDFVKKLFNNIYIGTDNEFYTTVRDENDSIKFSKISIDSIWNDFVETLLSENEENTEFDRVTGYNINMEAYRTYPNLLQAAITDGLLFSTTAVTHDSVKPNSDSNKGVLAIVASHITAVFVDPNKSSEQDEIVQSSQKPQLDKDKLFNLPVEVETIETEINDERIETDANQYETKPLVQATQSKQVNEEMTEDSFDDIMDNMEQNAISTSNPVMNSTPSNSLPVGVTQQLDEDSPSDQTKNVCG